MKELCHTRLITNRQWKNLWWIVRNEHSLCINYWNYKGSLAAQVGQVTLSCGLEVGRA